MSKFIRVLNPSGAPISWLINIDHIAAINTSTNCVFMSVPIKDGKNKLVVSPSSMQGLIKVIEEGE